jgi:hypothetical protein
MARTVTVKAGRKTGYNEKWTVDARDFKNLAKALRQANKKLLVDTQRELRAVGEIVATEARAIAAKDSQKIPPTVKVRVRGVGVSVVAGGSEETAIAGLFELGNTGSKKKSEAASRRGVFRHPVFGNRQVWVNQDMHPYLAPALKKNRNVVQERAIRILDKAAKTIADDYPGNS